MEEEDIWKVREWVHIVHKEDWEVLPNFFTTSSSKFIGREEILNFIDKVNLSLLKKS